MKKKLIYLVVFLCIISLALAITLTPIDESIKQLTKYTTKTILKTDQEKESTIIEHYIDERIIKIDERTHTFKITGDRGATPLELYEMINDYKTNKTPVIIQKKINDTNLIK